MNLNIAIAEKRMFNAVMREQSDYHDVRMMSVSELKHFIRRNKGVNLKIIQKRYTESDRILASQVLYAKNRLRMLGE
jgi:galactokinase